MVALAGCLGLSRSEFTGLKWSDFNWAERTLTVQRGVVSEPRREYEDPSPSEASASRRRTRQGSQRMASENTIAGRVRLAIRQRDGERHGTVLARQPSEAIREACCC